VGGVIFDRVHVIRVAALDRAKHCPPGGWVRIELGDTARIGYDVAWRIRGLVAGAARVQLAGSTESERRYLEDFLETWPVNAE